MPGNQADAVFRAVADPTRREILAMLRDRELSIRDIAKHFPASRTAIAKHLIALADAGLAASRRQGRETRYRLNPDPLILVQQWLSFFDTYWDGKLQALKTMLETPDPHHSGSP